MGPGYLIDTNTVIDFLTGSLPVTARKTIMEIEPVISVITQIELFSSSKTSMQEVLQLKAFIHAATIYNTIDGNIVEHAINIRKAYKIKTPDAIIAATALANDLTLLTRNVNDFKKIHHLKLINPWDI